MRINGPLPLDSENAETAYCRTFFYFQKIIAADLVFAESDDRRDRAIMGAVVAMRVLLEANPQFGFHCYKCDFREWKTKYLKWFDANAKRLQRTKPARDKMRRLAEQEFDRILALCQSEEGLYSFRGKLHESEERLADLRYVGKDGRLVKIPPLE